MESKMDEKDSTGVRPIVQRQEDFRERPAQKRFFSGTQDESEKQKEERPRRPTPLPFGKIDVIA